MTFPPGTPEYFRRDVLVGNVMADDLQLKIFRGLKSRPASLAIASLKRAGLNQLLMKRTVLLLA
jgi:hypothetical protein